MKRAEDLKYIPFPKCYDECLLGNYLGVGECENCCNWKFDNQGNSLEIINEKQKT